MSAKRLRTLMLSAVLGVGLPAFFAVNSNAQQNAQQSGPDPQSLTRSDLPPVVIPNFWDPKHRIERPPQGAVSSIRFITADDFPPFNFLDSGDQLIGFNIDLARAICDELDIPCTIQSREWDEIIDRIADKTADAAITGIAVTAAHRERLEFSDVYLQMPARFVVGRDEADLVTTPAGLGSRTVSVVERTAHEAYLTAMFPDVARKAYADADSARTAVKTGEADAHFGDALQLSFWLQSQAADGCCVFAGGPYLESHFFGLGHAIAVARGATATRQAINSALKAIYEKGKFAELYLRYFPVGFF